MQIVITLPDTYAEIIQKVQNGSVASKIILEAVKGGIVLPKNHGRLVDADELEKDMIHDQSRQLEMIDEITAEIKRREDATE